MPTNAALSGPCQPNDPESRYELRVNLEYHNITADEANAIINGLLETEKCELSVKWEKKGVEGWNK